VNLANLRRWAVEWHEVGSVSLPRLATVRHSVLLQCHLGRGHSCQGLGRRHSHQVARPSDSPPDQLSVSLLSPSRVPLSVRHHSQEVVGLHSDPPPLWALRALLSADHLNLISPSRGSVKRQSPRSARRHSQRGHRLLALGSNSCSSDPTRSQASLVNLRPLHKLVRIRGSNQVPSLLRASPMASGLQVVQLRRTRSQPRYLRRRSGHQLSRMATRSHSQTPVPVGSVSPPHPRLASGKPLRLLLLLAIWMSVARHDPRPPPTVPSADSVRYRQVARRPAQLHKASMVALEV